MGYVYFGSNDDLEELNYTKIGICENVKNRMDTYKTSSPYYGFKPYAILKCELKDAKLIEENLHIAFMADSLYHNNRDKQDNDYNGGLEWFNAKYNKNDIIEALFDTTYKYEIIEGELLDKFIIEEKRINRENKDKNYKKCNKEYKKRKKLKSKSKLNLRTLKHTDREYQTPIINYCHKTLIESGRVFLELATGGGKTFIVFKIMSFIKPEFIIIFAPRIQINSQNSSNSNLEQLNNEYETLNLSSPNNSGEAESFFKSNKKRIVFSCSQSSKKLYKLIAKYKIKNIFVWFDEAHWSFGEWLSHNDESKKQYKAQEHKKFWLENTENIKYRMFVSASPNKELIKEYQNIYGELYNPISVKELVNLDWLCSVESYQFAIQKDMNDVKLIKYVMQEFQDKQRNWGFSFHSKRINAFNMFYQHFLEYKKLSSKDSFIKPFLLIGDDFYNIFSTDIDKFLKNKKDVKDFLDQNTDEEVKYKKEDIKRIKRIIKDLKTKYDDITQYFKNDKPYDYKSISDYKDNRNSIGYVVQKYTMGFDFEKIDFIIIIDSKTSYQDIIQCLGRGLRGDKLGELGKNKDKVLHIHLPFYFKEENNMYKELSFDQIKKVLLYLIKNLNVDFDTMIINFKQHFKLGVREGYENKGIDDMKSKIMDLCKEANLIRPKTLKQLYKFCIKHNIIDTTKYKEYIKDNGNIGFKESVYEYPGFRWMNVVDPQNKLYYLTKKQCIDSKRTIYKMLENTLTEEEYEIKKEIIDNNVWGELHKYDAKIPPYCDLDKYYP